MIDAGTINHSIKGLESLEAAFIIDSTPYSKIQIIKLREIDVAM